MENGQNRTAVVILSYNSRKWHERFLPLIVAEKRGGYDVFVVDHASPDDTASYIEQNFPEVKLIRLTENHGFAWGYAQALNKINAKYYVLLSADFEVTPGWFAPLLKTMDEHPEMGACQPKIRFYRDKAYFEYAGAAGGFIDRYGYLFCRGRIFDTLEKDEGQYDDDCLIFWASGGCFMVRSDAYHKVGGLDADLESHFEEVDLCWRLRNAGYTIGYVADSTVFHVGGSVISYGSPQKTFFNFRNNLIILWKNEKAAKLVWLIPLRLVLDGIAGCQFLLKGRADLAKAVIRAHWHFFPRIGFWTKKRKQLTKMLAGQISTKSPKNADAGIYDGSIVAAYYLKGIKKFSDLKFHEVS